MKKTIIAFLVIILLLTVCGCGEKEKAEMDPLANYTAPTVVESDQLQTGGKNQETQKSEDETEKEEAADALKELKTREGDVITVQDYAESFPVETEKDVFTVFSLNLCSENGTENSSYMSRYESLIDLLLEANPDVIAFQEAGTYWMDYIVPNLESVYGYYMVHPDQSNQRVANPIFFKKEKFEDENGGYFWLSDTPAEESTIWSGDGKYNCMWLKLKDKESGNSAYVFNCQLGGTESDCQKGAKLILDKIEALGHKQPVVCALDLGLTTESEAYKTLTKQLVDANSKGNKTPTSHNYTGRGITADFLLHSGTQIEAESYEVNTALKNGTFVSDHYPLMGQFKMDFSVIDYSNEFIF